MNWDYEHGLLQVSASLHHFCGVPCSYSDDEVLQNWIQEHSFRCIITLLIDGMGTENLNMHLGPDSFFRSSLKESVSTVYPPTTTAATTSLLTGKSPAENGWLGWNQYFKEKDDQIILFRNMGQYTGKTYPNFSWETLPIEPITTACEKRGILADSVWPKWGIHNPCRTYEAFLKRTHQIASCEKVRFIYAYWDELDDLMHRKGPSSTLVKEELENLDALTAEFAKNLPADVGLVILADHGQIEVSHYAMDQDHDLVSCFRKAPSLEARTTAFFIRNDCMEIFPVLFRKKYGEQFTLLTHKEVVESGIFGPGVPNQRFEEFLGDFVAFAKTEYQLDYKKGYELKGNHAGLLKEERMIPIILVP